MNRASERSHAKPVVPSYAELVLQWSKTAHSLSADERRAVLQLELDAARENRRLGVKSSVPPAVERAIEEQRQILESYSLSEDRCFEAQARQIHTANGVCRVSALDPDVVLDLHVRNHFVSLRGSHSVATELQKQAEALGQQAHSGSVWCQGSENTYVSMRKYTMGFEPDTTVMDTITFNIENFTITHIQRTLLPSHNSDPSHHIPFGGIQYL